MSKKLKRNLKRIIISLSAFIIIFLSDIIFKNVFEYEFGIASIINNKYGWLLTLSLYLIVYIYIGYDVLIKAFKNIIHGQAFDENFLMCVATIGAFGLGIYKAINGEEIEGFDEACAVLLFYQVGEWFQSYAVGKSRKSISSLMDIRPDYANLKTINNEYIQVDPSEVNVDDIILVKPGEKIPLDGIVISGTSSIDSKALTGESLPVDVNVNDDVISGTINLSQTIEVKVLKKFYDSTVSKILDLVENASNHKSKSENFISKFAKYYTPIVVIAALLLALIPGIITKDFSIWIYRALNFLVVSCPCALVISIPLSFFAGIGGASKNGILIKGSTYLEQYNKANIFVFDKTGTLTKGNFIVSKINATNKEEILHLASIAEKNSNHPIALSIKKAYGKEIVEDYHLENIAGKGIVASKENIILCGNEKLMLQYNIDYKKEDEIGSIVYVACNGKFVGSIVINDEIKEDANDTINYLNSIGAKTIMLTGDNELIASNVADKLNLTTYKSSLLPQDKVEEVNKLLEKKNKNDVLCFVGDGINDAPVLMQADIGISMGGVGSDAAIEASDIVLMHDNLSSIALSKKLANKTMKIVYQNIIFAIAIKLLILVLSAFGITNMWFAVFGDVGVAVICILNAMRANSKIK